MHRPIAECFLFGCGTHSSSQSIADFSAAFYVDTHFPLLVYCHRHRRATMTDADMQLWMVWQVGCTFCVVFHHDRMPYQLGKQSLGSIALFRV